ncbi:2-amino-4-hydroxy-6-hydroxymethyldihydropteridine diphosphokinase [Ideonella sp. 4Y16]|uniref:2-amino-4-hydroxy-6-hydroxymethyldihydropteridine pyrophosphokinase n=1 Tax=Ideonella alba TaxID=2824118 RepID=A0A941BDA7_9BURK|nr:2-amino-4-hydroxy-6-hydroxymethyldihydropteridine diphosphokinase [Ideonella alba]MBQ0932805.1 2-amino-4-hydroxy-6-hydroxymethyldihydropteridine diphosphokinase [Ideonella alba]MBQ0945979.1 2-amino-4-hydroxy-6-hydroxymethyldihydropteridine diphosphokinase [Ideonella alba]
MTELAYIGLGANLGDAQGTLRLAWQALTTVAGVEGDGLSGLWRSAPVDAGGPDYVNAVGRVRTALAPRALLAVLQDIEQRHGRERPYRNAPRTLDLDLLLYGQLVQDDPVLTLPHPRMHQRAFVLRPLAQLAPELALAQGDWPTLLAAVADQRLEPL